MRIVRPISEDEMIAVFLRAEVDSGRYGETLRGFVDRDGRDPDVLRRPDLRDPNAPPPELIVVTTSGHSPLVLVEGHFRLTAYAVFPDYVPDELEILLGVSDEMAEWCQL